MGEEKKERKAGISTQDRKNRGDKSYWWLPVACGVLFLLVVGYYASTAMRQSAQKLVGGDSYSQLSANSAIYAGGRAVSADENYFTSEEQPLAGGQEALPEALPAAAARLQVPGELTGKETDIAASAAAEPAQAGEGGSSGGHGAQAYERQPMPLAIAARLQGKGASLVTAGGQSPVASGQARFAAFQSGGALAEVATPQNNLKAAGPAKGGGSSVLESLKGALRASVYGARSASQDSAKGWIARSFDAAPEAATAIKYAEKMRSLDAVNTDSIPNFLRDQDLSAAGVTTLSVAEVSKPVPDNGAGATDAKKARENALKDLMPGMMNSLFKGLTPNSEPETDGAAQPYGNPKSEPDIKTVDEYGYVTYEDKNGFQKIYDKDGAQMGCCDTAATPSSCISFGLPGCK